MSEPNGSGPRQRWTLALTSVAFFMVALAAAALSLLGALTAATLRRTARPDETSPEPATAPIPELAGRTSP